MQSRSLESDSSRRTRWPRRALLILELGKRMMREELRDFVREKSDYDDFGDGKRKKFEKDGIGSSRKREKKLKSKSEGRDGSKLKLKKAEDSSERSRDQNDEAEVKEMWDTIARGDSKEVFIINIKMMPFSPVVYDTGVDPADRYGSDNEPRSPGDAPQAFLAYGIPQNNIKVLLVSLVYNVRGHVVSTDTIQNSILGCHMSRPGQIRIYTPKRVFQELEVAKEEYIRATFGKRKDQKILLPKTVDSTKDSGLCLAGLLEMIQQYVPESVRKSIKKYQAGKSRKSIEWIPYNFVFQYLISKELVK